jgi:hypothetical protein
VLKGGRMASAVFFFGFFCGFCVSVSVSVFGGHRGRVGVCVHLSSTSHNRK